MSGLKFLYNLLLKEAAKGSGKASGIMSIGPDIRKITMNKYAKYLDSAKKQGVDLDKMSEEEIKYILQLNKPKGPMIGEHRVIDATSSEGQGITRDLFNVLDRQSGKNVIKTDFGGGITDDVSEIIIKIKTMEPMEAMKEANKVLKGDGRYKSLSKADRKKIVDDESVTDHIFEREIKPDPEDLAQGGRTGTGLNYLLGEDDQNMRVPFKEGTKFNPKRRGFLKLAAGLATLPFVGKYFKWAKPLAKSSEVLTSVPIKDIEGMPAWFKPLANQIIKKGKQIESGAERVIVHEAKLPGSKTKMHLTQELDTGNVAVEIGQGKHGFGAGHHGQPVRLEYKAAENIEPVLSKTGKTKTKGGKTKEEFWVEEAEWTGGHPENVKFDDSTFNKFGQHGSDFTEVEKFATGKVKSTKPTKKRLQTEYESGKAEADAERWTEEAMDDVDMASGGRVPFKVGGRPYSLGQIIDPDFDDMDPDEWLHIIKQARAGEFGAASGGRVPMLFGGGIFKTIIQNLAKAKGVNPSDYLKVTNYKSLPREVRNLMSEADFAKMKAGRIEMFENWVEMAKTRKEFLKNIEQGKKTPAAPVFEHLEKSFKSPVPHGVTDKDILQGEFILKNLKTKGRKPNASGGRVSLSAGGLAGMLGE